MATNKKEIKPITTLTQATNMIFSLEESTRRNLYAISSTLYRVEALKLYESGDYKSTVQYAEETFGYKRATSQALIRVAGRFLQGNSSKFKNPDEKDYTVYQLMELLPMDDTQITEAIENGELNPYMTTKAIRELAKGYKMIEDKAKAEVEAPKAEVEAPKAEVEAPKAEVEAPKAEVEAPKAEAEGQGIDCTRVLNKLAVLYKGVDLIKDASKQSLLSLNNDIITDVGALKVNAQDATVDLINSCSEIMDYVKMENINNESLTKSLVDLLIGLENLKKLF